MNYTKSDNDGRHIFVFGSNEKGRHGKGAALDARRYWGAVPGRGYGRQGMSFAIPTKDQRLKPLSLKEIEVYVHRFLVYARHTPHMTFLVTKIGCGLAGYRESDISPLFMGAPKNCEMPEGWR